MSGATAFENPRVPKDDIHKDDYDPVAAQEVINSNHILHVTFPADIGKKSDPYPTVLSLIGKMGSYPGRGVALYVHGFVPEALAQRINADPGGLFVSIAASKTDSYYLGLTPFSHGFVFQTAILNGRVHEIKYDEVKNDDDDDEQVKDEEINDHEKLWALHHIVDGIIPQEWENTRRPFKKAEVDSVHVLRVDIETKSSHVHKRQSILGYERQWDLENNSADKYWEGAIPLWETYGEPIYGPHNKMDGVPPHVSAFFKKQKKENEEYAEKEAKKVYTGKYQP